MRSKLTSARRRQTASSQQLRAATIVLVLAAVVLLFVRLLVVPLPVFLGFELLQAVLVFLGVPMVWGAILARLNMVGAAVIVAPLAASLIVPLFVLQLHLLALVIVPGLMLVVGVLYASNVRFLRCPA